MVVATDAAMEGDWPEASSRKMAKDLVALSLAAPASSVSLERLRVPGVWGLGAEAGDPPVKRDEGWKEQATQGYASFTSGPQPWHLPHALCLSSQSDVP